MKEAENTTIKKKPVWKKLIIPVALVILGIIIAFPIFFGTMTAMVVTSSPEFCSSCHEIKPAVQAWAGSTHHNNARGLVAECMDCHLPPPEDTLRFFVMKTYHGVKDLTFHFLRGSEGYDREEAREGMYQSVTNDVCLRCHQNVLFMPQNRGAMLAHRAVIYARAGYEKKCIDCHYDLVHNNPAAVMYHQYRQLPYQAKGLKPEKLGS